MRPDPPVRPNCPCGLPRHPERSRKYAQGQADRDPFCSTTCARDFHGTALPKQTQHGPPAKTPICGTYGAYKAGCKCETCLRAVRDSTRRYRERKKAAA